MKVILTKDMENPGKAGALVEVKPGYGDSYGRERDRESMDEDTLPPEVE